MGVRHLMVTSWLGTSFESADFGTGKPWKWPDMPGLNGLVNLIDAAPPVHLHRFRKEGMRSLLQVREFRKRRRHEDGLVIRVVLEPTCCKNS